MVLVARTGSRRLVSAVCPAAQGLGVRIGMAAAQASALVPDLRMEEAEPEADLAALNGLAHFVYRLYTPTVAPDAPDGLLLDITGAAHRFGGETGLVEHLSARLAAFGVAACCAVADTVGAAHALARHLARPGSPVITEGSRLLQDLSVSALRLSPELGEALSRVGLETIGDLERRPRAGLALRYGTELIQRLDQAFGRVEEPIIAIAPQETLTVERRFAEPISAPETLNRYATGLVERLCLMLEERGQGVRRVRLEARRLDNRTETLVIGLARPARSPDRLMRLIAPRLEEIDCGFGLEAMALIAQETAPLDWRAQERDLAADKAPAPDLAPLIEGLQNRLGENRLYRLAPTTSELPERCERRVAPMGETPADLPDWREAWPVRWPRPARLLARPEPIETVAMIPDYPPAAFTWRGVRRRVRRADGPERLYGEWWRRESEREAVRDYFQLEDETGRRFFVFRAGDGERPLSGSQGWFLHGLFG